MALVGANADVGCAEPVPVAVRIWSSCWSEPDLPVRGPFLVAARGATFVLTACSSCVDKSRLPSSGAVPIRGSATMPRRHCCGTRLKGSVAEEVTHRVVIAYGLVRAVVGRGAAVLLCVAGVPVLVLTLVHALLRRPALGVPAGHQRRSRLLASGADLHPRRLQRRLLHARRSHQSLRAHTVWPARARLCRALWRGRIDSSAGTAIRRSS